jgi:hypothetical protein
MSANLSTVSRLPCVGEGVRRLLIGLIGLLVFSASAPARAQADGPRRTVVLDVGESGGETLRDVIGGVDDIEVKDQKWFVRQIRKHDVRAHKIMKRPRDLRVVMSGGEIDYVIAVIPEDDTFEGAFYDSTGEQVHRFTLEGGGEFSQTRAEEVRGEFEQFLGVGFAMGEEEVAQEAPAEPVEPADPEPVRTADTSATLPAGELAWLTIEPAARLFKRDLSFVGEGGAALTFRSAFYPGASFDGAIFPSNAMFGDVGIGGYLTGALGFDSLTTGDDSLPIMHLEGAGGVALRLPASADLRVRLGGRHARYTLDSNDALPSLTQTLITAGFRASHQFGAIVLDGLLEVIPFGVHGSDARLFGESSRLMGFSGGLTLRYEFSDVLGAAIGYSFRAIRSRFPGDGTLEFRDTVGFELVQGPRVGITLHY